MIIIGIDPGLTGGIAWIDLYRDNPQWQARPMPRDNYGVDRARLARFFYDVGHEYDDHNECSVFLEKVHAMPKNGAVSMFSFGRAYECPAAMVSMMGQETALNEVIPVKWQDAMLGKKPRQSEIDVVKRVAPHFNPYPMTPSGKKQSTVAHSGMLDAILIGEYGRRMLSLDNPGPRIPIVKPSRKLKG